MKIAIAFLGLGLLAFPHQGIAVTKTLASAPVGPSDSSGNFLGSIVSCSIFNAGADPVTFTARAILNSAGVAQALSVDTCSIAPLLPKHSCEMEYTNAVVNGRFACRIKAKGATVKVRGVAVFRPDASSVLMSTPIE